MKLSNEVLGWAGAVCLSSLAPRCVIVAASACVAHGELTSGVALQDPSSSAWLLDPIRERIAQSDPDGARALLQELQIEGVDVLIEGLQVAESEALLGELQGLCRAVSSRELRALVLEALHDGRVARCEPADPQLLDTKSLLAGARYQIGDLRGALELEQQVVDALELELGPEDLELMRAKGNLASSLHDVGELEQSLALKREVLEVFERALPPDHMDLLFAKGNLAVTLAELGDMAGAYELELQVHDGFERVLPANHPNLLYSKSNLATSLADLGDLQAALALDREVLAARRSFQGENHPDLLASWANLGLRMRALGDYEGALIVFEEVSVRLQAILPEEHPSLLNAQLNLAGTRSQLGDFEGGHALFEHVLEVRSRILPADHPDLLAAMQGLANTLGELGDLEGALALEEEIYAARIKFLAEDHPERIQITLNLASTLSSLGHAQRAAELEAQGLSALERSVPAGHPKLLKARSNRIGNLAETGELEQALVLADEVMLGCESLPAGHPTRLTVRVSLAVLRARLGDLEGARSAARTLQADLEVSLESAFLAPPREARARALEAVTRLAKIQFVRDLDGGDSADLDASSLGILETARHAVSLPLDVHRAAQESPELDQLRSQLAQAEHALDGLVAEGPDPREGERADELWRARVHDLSSRREKVQRDLLALLPRGDQSSMGVSADARLARARQVRHGGGRSHQSPLRAVRRHPLEGQPCRPGGRRRARGQSRLVIGRPRQPAHPDRGGVGRGCGDRRWRRASTFLLLDNREPEEMQPHRREAVRKSRPDRGQRRRHARERAYHRGNRGPANLHRGPHPLRSPAPMSPWRSGSEPKTPGVPRA